MKNDGSGNLLEVESDGSTRPFSEALSDVQIIVNGTLQDTDHPKCLYQHMIRQIN